jgi:ABC-2 type transport system permease protein
LTLVLFSKILAQIFYEIPRGIVSVASVLLVVRHIPDIANPVLLPVSIILAIIGLGVLSLFLAALVVLAGGRSGFFMGIVPFGAVLSGFILPVQQLPRGLALAAHLMPTSWAMDGIWLAVRDANSLGSIVGDWGMSILLISAWFLITVWMCRIVEKRIRVKGTLGTF